MTAERRELAGGGNAPGRLHLRFFGVLRSLALDRGLQECMDVEIPQEGVAGSHLAARLGMPRGRIEAMFRNGRVQRLEEKVFPGDRAAFIPRGTPGPYRVLLGIFRREA